MTPFAIRRARRRHGYRPDLRLVRNAHGEREQSAEEELECAAARHRRHFKNLRRRWLHRCGWHFQNAGAGEWIGVWNRARLRDPRDEEVRWVPTFKTLLGPSGQPCPAMGDPPGNVRQR